MHLGKVFCPVCSDEISFTSVVCTGCGNQSVGYPNVRYADDKNEKDGLDRLYESALAESTAKGSRKQLLKFETDMNDSFAITVMKPVDLISLLAEGALWVSFYKRFRGSGGKFPELNKWDLSRGANDAKVNPLYSDEINYAALSLNEFGAGWYGGCHIKLNSDRIASRASVFWENPFKFLRRVPVLPDETIPPGYRASWERRGRLAVAKLHEHISASTPEDEFPKIVVEHDSSSGDTDFIEVHIFGPVSSTAFDSVVVDKAGLSSDELLLLESIMSRLARRGIPAKEATSA